MSKKIWVAILAISLVVLPGCANGPCRQFFRGGQCNSCFPWFGRQRDKCADEYDGVSYPGAANCPDWGSGSAYDGQAPGSEIIVPGTIEGPLNADPYSGAPIVPGEGALPRPR